MCGPLLPILAGVGAVVGVGAALSGAEDAEDAYHKQATIDYQAGQQAKKVADYNAGVFRENAVRIREEQIARLNTTYTVNHERVYDALDTNVSRIDTALETNLSRVNKDLANTTGRVDFTADESASRLVSDYTRYTGIAGREYSMVAERLNDDFTRLTGQIDADATKDMGRLDLVTNELIRRLGRKATETATEGFEKENDYRQEIAFRVSEQRSYYAAGNVLLNTGTPAALQLDMKQQGNVQALRIRRDYAIRVQDLHETADDTAREALFKIDDIRTSAQRAVDELGVKTFRELEDNQNTFTDRVTDLTTDGIRQYNDVQTTRSWDIADLMRSSSRDIADLTSRAVDTKIDLHAEANRSIIDMDTGLAYDISDANADADNLDQQAVLTQMQGDAAAIAGVNRAKANRAAGSNAISNGYIDAAAAAVGGATDYLNAIG
jgi:hypothetical protein